MLITFSSWVKNIIFQITLFHLILVWHTTLSQLVQRRMPTSGEMMLFVTVIMRLEHLCKEKKRCYSWSNRCILDLNISRNALRNVDYLHALQINAHRMWKDNRSSGMKLPCSDLIDKHVLVLTHR